MRKIHFISFALLAVLILAMPAASTAQIGVGLSIRVGPPALPVYDQPLCPGPGFLWTPGYWAYGDDGYYWVPGTWVEAPAVGLLWTPGYWGWGNGFYLWHGGYWGPHVGFYGGINYGFGYGGVGFFGGEWRGGVFAYNTAVMHVDERYVHNTYVEQNRDQQHEREPRQLQRRPGRDRGAALGSRSDGGKRASYRANDPANAARAPCQHEPCIPGVLKQRPPGNRRYFQARPVYGTRRRRRERGE